MNTIRKYATIPVLAAITALLLLLAAGASSLVAGRGEAASPEVADRAPIDAASAVCEATSDDQAAPKKPCNGACPGKPYCTCTYNGQPRVSCDPCCYQTYTGEICLD